MINFNISPIETVRIGFIGLGSRGVMAVERYTRIQGVRICAVCDKDPEQLKKVRSSLDYSKGVSEYSGPQSWRRLCENPSIDLVYICTDWLSHTEIACYAMECGRHVAVEVPASTSVEESWRLVRTAEATRRHCMMLENCVYDIFEASTLNMVQDNIFGDVYHAEGGYIHNLTYLRSWRSDFNRTHRGDNYPTHGFGPLCRILGIHRTDALDTIASYATELPERNHIVSVIRTKRAKTIILQHNINAARPYTRQYMLLGEKGSASKYPSPLISMLPSAGEWLSDDEYRSLMDRYRPDYYEQVRSIMPPGEEERRYMDYAMDFRLIYCLRNGLPLDMDVYDAAEWSCINELSHISIESGSIPVAFPDFLAR